MSTKVNMSPVFVPYTNKQGAVEVDAAKNVGVGLNQVAEFFPKIKPELFDDDGNLRYYVNIYVNGESPYPNLLTKSVKNKDKVYIVFLVAGG